MTDPQQALAEYSARVADTDMIRRPVIWGVHYDTDGRKLGEIGVPAIRDNVHHRHAVVGVLGPFAYVEEITECYLVVNRTQPVDLERTMKLSRLAAAGAELSVAHWNVPYAVNDEGLIFYDAPEPCQPEVPTLEAFVGLGEARWEPFVDDFTHGRGDPVVPGVPAGVVPGPGAGTVLHVKGGGAMGRLVGVAAGVAAYWQDSMVLAVVAAAWLIAEALRPPKPPGTIRRAWRDTLREHERANRRDVR